MYAPAPNELLLDGKSKRCRDKYCDEKSVSCDSECVVNDVGGGGDGNDDVGEKLLSA